jgi:large subunit ribosomal protein L25
MDTVNVSARSRFLSGSDVAKKVRRAGYLPAVMYGQGFGNKVVAVEPQGVKKGLQGPYGRNAMFDVTLDGVNHLAIAKEVQLHPVTRQLVHVDLLVVKPDSKLVVTVPVVLSGRSVGQKAGGRLEQTTRYVKLACTPETLPKLIEIDLTPFDNGTLMTIETLPLPAGVTPMFKRSFKIFEIIAAKVEEKPVEEVKGKGKK